METARLFLVTNLSESLTKENICMYLRKENDTHLKNSNVCECHKFACVVGGGSYDFWMFMFFLAKNLCSIKFKGKGVDIHHHLHNLIFNKHVCRLNLYVSIQMQF